MNGRLTDGQAWPARRAALLAAVVALLIGSSGCGGNDDARATSDSPSEAMRAAALSLQQAMDGASRSIDGVRGTRASLERVGASLEPAIAQTGDVIGLLASKSDETSDESRLLAAAREQRMFVQYAADATRARSRSAARSAIARSRTAGRRASDAYAEMSQHTTALAGLLPSATTFNTGRLRDAVIAASRPKNSPGDVGSSGGRSSSGRGSSASTSCGDGLSVNAATSCPFARNVRDAYQSSGGDSVIEVYSPVTEETYIMSCGAGVPTVCTGGNGAVVAIR